MHRSLEDGQLCSTAESKLAALTIVMVVGLGALSSWCYQLYEGNVAQSEALDDVQRALSQEIERVPGRHTGTRAIADRSMRGLHRARGERQRFIRVLLASSNNAQVGAAVANVDKKPIDQARRKQMTAAVEHTEVNRLRDALVQIATQHGTSIEELKPPPGYGHLPLAIIDSVYSLRSPYSAARAAVSAYCTRANIVDRGSADGARDDLVEHTIQDFLSTLSRSRGDELTTWFGGARYKAPGTNTLKAEVCVAAAEALHIANVNERRDLDNATRFASAKGNWRSVRGLGQQSWSYFTMLVGVEDWKVDTWVNGFVVDVVGRDVTSMEARALLDAATANLAAELEGRLSKRALDHAIWQSASGRHPR